MGLDNYHCKNTLVGWLSIIKFAVVSAGNSLRCVGARKVDGKFYILCVAVVKYSTSILGVEGSSLYEPPKIIGG